jgi:hypothetical protein
MNGSSFITSKFGRGVVERKTTKSHFWQLFQSWLLYFSLVSCCCVRAAVKMQAIKCLPMHYKDNKPWLKMRVAKEALYYNNGLGLNRIIWSLCQNYDTFNWPPLYNSIFSKAKNMPCCCCCSKASYSDPKYSALHSEIKKLTIFSLSF